MSKRWILALVGMLAVGVTLGVVAGVFLFDGDSDGESPTTAPPEVCADARGVVDLATAALTDLSQAGDQNPTFYAAILVEQRTITYAMDAEPTCFTLGERAAAEGLIDGIRGLLEATSAAAANQTAPVSVNIPSDQVPTDTGVATSDD